MKTLPAGQPVGLLEPTAAGGPPEGLEVPIADPSASGEVPAFGLPSRGGAISHVLALRPLANPLRGGGLISDPKHVIARHRHIPNHIHVLL